MKRIQEYVVPVETGPCADQVTEYTVRASSVEYAIKAVKAKLSPSDLARGLIVASNVRPVADIPKWTVDDVIANLDNTIRGKLALRERLDPMMAQIIDINVDELKRIKADLEKVKQSARKA
jgi:hypothetical protein